MKRMFRISAHWDEEAKVFYSESDIIGLHIETKTIEEFEAVMEDVAIDLILANHITKPEKATLPLEQLVPAILWQRPENCAVA